MSELSRTTAVPVATIKYYLREGLLPAGRAMAATQAEYDDTHVQRLRLIRALVDVGGLSLAAVQAVVAALDAGTDADQVSAAVATAHDALAPVVDAATDAPTHALAALQQLGWRVNPDSAAVRQLDAALAAVADVGLPADADRIRAYAEAALAAARVDIASMPTGSSGEAVRHAVVGTVMYEPVLLALRRLAQQHVFGTQQAGFYQSS